VYLLFKRCAAFKIIDNFKMKDLLFLSMTYEKMKKTNEHRKIPFKTVVVSDQTKLNEIILMLTNYTV
jgi:hypothetical protein